MDPVGPEKRAGVPISFVVFAWLGGLIFWWGWGISAQGREWPEWRERIAGDCLFTRQIRIRTLVLAKSPVAPVPWLSRLASI